METEQVLLQGDGACVASLQQVRGSIPLYWRQNIDLRYKPPFELDERDGEQSQRVMNVHFQQLQELYGTPIVALNLIDGGKRSEGILERAFAYHVAQIPNVK